jgi:anti-sigma28 factor (negative regulator of flagellin synthesis)
MQAIRKPSVVAHLPQSTSEARTREAQSPEQNASSTSGTYFRAVRPSEGDAAALARGEPLLDRAKVEGLRFELDVGVWRGDSERMARRVIVDAAFVDDSDAADD